MLTIRNFLFAFCLLVAFGIFSFAQTTVPSEEERETILTEEIKVNVSAFDADGQLVTDLKKDDLVIIENGRLQQANAIRRVPANVLILLDTGGFMRGNLSLTRAAAKNLVESLLPGARVSIFQFGDRAEMLSGWNTDKSATLDVLDKKLTFGKRNVLDQAVYTAVSFFNEKPLENRHLVLITGGVDSFNDRTIREAAVANLMATDINLHIVCLAHLQKGSVASQKSVFNEGQWKPRRLPEEVVETLPDPKRPGKEKDREITQKDMAKMPRLGGVTLDIDRYKKAKAGEKNLEAAKVFLETLATDTNGLFLLPETVDELPDKIATVARIINSQYVIAYTPKQPLKSSPAGEMREIEVSSRRSGVRAEARRKLIVGHKP